VGVAALLVLSPGPTFAIVTRNAATGGRGPGLATAAGIGVANATYAAAAALGLSVVLERSPAAFTTIRLAGAAYLVWLGASGLWRVTRGDAGGPGLRPGRRGRRSETWATGFRQGVLTNLLHPSIAVFYLSYIPQFIRPGQPFLARYTLLAAIHVAMSTGWMSMCALAVDRLARVLRTPAFARTIETLASVSLLVLGVVVAFSR
jgi:threonine/homoserine/homoserine lactone efflux protein